MNERNSTTEVSAIFDSLVKNAIDFFEHSVNEFDRDPKYSLIHFYASIELFFKARLLLEHWSLITEKPQDAKFQKFLQGEFSSVGLDGAMSRLEGISGEEFDKQVRDIFNKIRDHRNRSMHFFMSDGVNHDDNSRFRVAVEQCRGWYYLHKLLTKTWKPNFDNYGEQLDRLHLLMLKQKEYLEGVYQHKQQQINWDMQKGITYIECPACNYLSGKLLSEEIGPVSVTCVVCENHFFGVKTTCPHCKKNVAINAFSECPNCKTIVHYLDTMEMLSEDNYQWAYCHKCEVDALPTIVKIPDGWFCFACFSKYEDRDIGRCGYCGKTVSGEKGDNYTPGCFLDMNDF